MDFGCDARGDSAAGCGKRCARAGACLVIAEVIP